MVHLNLICKRQKSQHLGWETRNASKPKSKLQLAKHKREGKGGRVGTIGSQSKHYVKDL